MVAYGRLKTKEKFKFQPLKVVTVAYEGWSLAKCSKLLAFWTDWLLRRGGCLRGMVATGVSTVFYFSYNVKVDVKV